jgi:hypothetical protein
VSHLPDATVRALVTELSAFHVDDIAAILAGLPERERRAVEGYLAEHESKFQAILAASGEGELFNNARISPWLAIRVHSKDQARHSMTRHASQALLACAAKLFPGDGRAA